jgi:hypothetical protein
MNNKYTFETALVYLKQGKKIKRATWDSLYGYLVIVDATIYNVWTDGYGKVRKGVINIDADDIMAEDWEVIQ